MKRLIVLQIFLVTAVLCQAQYSKEKITSTLTGDNVRSWSATGINTELTEKKFSFNKNNSVVIEYSKGTTKNDKWTLTSPDKIRWFLSIGNTTYELIISYDKKGNEYIKLTHQAGDNKTSGYYEIKLNAIK